MLGFLLRLVAVVAGGGAFGGYAVDLIFAEPTFWRSVVISLTLIIANFVVWRDSWSGPRVMAVLRGKSKLVESSAYLLAAIPFAMLISSAMPHEGALDKTTTTILWSSLGTFIVAGGLFVWGYSRLSSDVRDPVPVHESTLQGETDMNEEREKSATSGRLSPIINQRDNNVNIIGERQNISIQSAQARRLTSGARGMFVDAVSSEQRIPVDVTADMNNPESFQFAQDILDALTEAGWTVNGVNQAISSRPIIGVVVQGSEEQEPQIRLIGEALLKLGVKTEGGLFPSDKKLKFTVRVGSNPN